MCILFNNSFVTPRHIQRCANRCLISLVLVIFSSSAWSQSNTNVLSFGAIPDGLLRNDGSMVAGSATLTSASSNFSSADVGKYIQVIGAGPGGTSRSDARMSAGSATLTSSSGSFTSADVGRGVVVVSAGPNGGNLVARIVSYVSPTSVVLSQADQVSVTGAAYYYGGMTLEATIQSVESNSSLTLSTPALATISSAVFAYGTENHSAFQSAVDTVGQAGGGVVAVPSPSTCPSGAVCGYVLKASDQMTAKAPGAVKIRYNNVSLIGDSPQTNLFCRGAFGSYTNSAAFPGTTGNIRGFCLSVGDDGGPNGTAGESVSNVTIAQLHLYGMTNGNTYNVDFGYPPQSPTGDGWDVTHKAIYMWDNSSFSNITIDSVVIQDFKAENIYSGGSPITGMAIKNSTITNFNGNGISMLAADLQVLNNTISNGSNAAVENSTVSAGSSALVRQLYQGNTISQMSREGIVVVGVDGGISSGTVQILNNSFDTIAQVNRSGTASAIYIASQNNYVPPANVTVTGNTCHDCYSFGVFQTSGNTLVQANNFVVDKYSAGNIFNFTYPMQGTTISGNTGSLTAQAQASSLSIGSVFMINPGYASGSFPWKNVLIKGNTWNFAGSPQYQFVTSSGLGWGLLTSDNLNWQGDVCNGCTHSDPDHGSIDLSHTTVIKPLGPIVYVQGNSSPVIATIDASKQEDGSQLQIVNAGSFPISFTSDSNLSLANSVNLPGQSNSSVTFVYSSALHKFTLAGTQTSITASQGTPQSTNVNSVFPTTLQVFVKDSNNNALSGMSVTFTTPGSGASASFGGANSVTAVTGSTGLATAPALTANSQSGAYSVSASINSVAGAPTALFNLTNTPVVTSTGNLSGSGNSSSANVNLTSEGAVDWEHWGDTTINRKATSVQQLSSYRVVGNGTVLTYSNDPRTVTWSNGSPTATSSANGKGIYISGFGQGFSFTAPADSTSRTLVVHVGGWYSGGTLTAHLSDNSAPDFTDSTVAVMGQYDRNYTLTFQAAGPGQTLSVAWVMTSGVSSGNVTLSAASAVGWSASASSGTPQTTIINSVFAAPLQVTVTGVGGVPVSGASVTFTAPASGPAASFGGQLATTVVTNTSGAATAPALTANSLVGSYSVVANLTGIDTPVTFSLNNLPGPPAAVTAIAGTPQSAMIGAAFSTPLQALVKDSVGDPLANVSVTFAAPGSGPSASFGTSTAVTAATNVNGIVTAPNLIANAQSGSYSVTAGVAGASEAVFALTNLPSTTGAQGVLSGSTDSATAAVNLTTEGSTDWVHWGDGTLNRKSGGLPMISTYTLIGSGSPLGYSNDPRPVSWTDGSPLKNSTGNRAGLYINSRGNGFAFTVPADTTLRKLVVHVGGWLSAGTLTAHLSDGSAPDFINSTSTANGQYDRNYTLVYKAASTGKTLQIRWINSANGGNVTISAAALQ